MEGKNMRYIVTGSDGQLGGRVASNMLKEVFGDQLIFTCPDKSRLRKERYYEKQSLLRKLLT